MVEIILALIVATIAFVFLKRLLGLGGSGTRPMVSDVAPVAGFTRRPLLNALEMRTYLLLDRWVRERETDLHVSAQVSMGEFLAHPDPEEYRRINTKRVDFALFDSAGKVCAVIEADGRGHWGTSAHSAKRARERDLLKDRATSAAKIPLIRFSTGMSNSQLRDALDCALVDHMPPERADALLHQRRRDRR